MASTNKQSPLYKKSTQENHSSLSLCQLLRQRLDTGYSPSLTITMPNIYPPTSPTYEDNLSEEQRGDTYTGNYLQYSPNRFDSVLYGGSLEQSATPNQVAAPPPTPTSGRRIRPSRVPDLNWESDPFNSPTRLTGTEFGSRQWLETYRPFQPASEYVATTPSRESNETTWLQSPSRGLAMSFGELLDQVTDYIYFTDLRQIMACMDRGGGGSIP